MTGPIMDTAAVTAAIREVADTEILPKFRALADDEIIEKRPGDVVTVADRLAEQALTRIFRAANPDCLVVGEEGIYADPTPLKALPTADLAWVIDPIDGTRNFASGSPDFAVMVAEVRSGVTTRGWIWQPQFGRGYVVERGAGVLKMRSVTTMSKSNGSTTEASSEQSVFQRKTSLVNCGKKLKVN